MPQRVSNEELNLALTNWKFVAAIQMDLRRHWARELAEDLADARAALKIAVEALERVMIINHQAAPEDDQPPEYNIPKDALDRIKQLQRSDENA